tara:strand:- start:7744 stop:8499 length:756 start_codon:yes stop_codon:yes gene_type:complete
MVKTKKRNYIKNKKITKKKDCGCKYGGTNTDIDYPTVGTVVEAKWSSRFGPGKEWYRGKITNVHPGKTSSRNPSFDVEYDDGEFEEKVKWENIRMVNAPSVKNPESPVNMGPPEPKYPPKKLARLPYLQTPEEYHLQVTGYDKDVVDALLDISKTKPKKKSKKAFKTKRDFKPSKETLDKFQMPPAQRGGLEPFIQVEEEINSPQIIIIHNDDEFEEEHDQRKLFNLLMGFTGMIAISATAIAYSIRDLIM